MAAGDTTTVTSGDYTAECLAAVRSGSADRPITLAGVGMPLLGAINIDHAYITVDGFSFRSHRDLGACVYFNCKADHCIIQNCAFEHTLPDKAQVSMESGDWGNRPTNMSLFNNRFLGNTYFCVALQGKGHLVKGNYFGTPSTVNKTHDGVGLYLHSSNTLVSQNTWENYDRPNPAAHCDLIQAFTNNGEIARDNIIERNLFRNGVGTQLGNLEDQGDHGRIARWTWRNNIWMNIEAGCGIGPDQQYFYNNVFYRCGTAGPLLFNVAGNTGGNSSGCKVINNIFYECGTSNKDSVVIGWWGFNPNGNFGTGFEAHHNLVFGWAGYQGFVKNATWNQGGQNGHSFNGVDPLFVNPAGGDFRLKKGSPCIGAGVSFSTEFGDDANGAPRGDAWDIGAVQTLPPGTIKPVSR